MRSNRFWILLFAFLFFVVKLPAQQYDADRRLLQSIRTNAGKGDAISQCALGEIYSAGMLGVSTNLAEAVKWFHRAADQGIAEAQYNLGRFYESGEGVTRDKSKAVRFYRRAAEQGYAFAQNSLGLCCANGNGIDKNAKAAAEWYRKAADQGCVSAQNNLANCYSKGDGVSKDEAEAVKWYRKAAGQGAAAAECALGICYASGSGCTQDLVEAGRWIRRAAEQGYMRAEMLLGNFYAEGTGVPQDYVEAYKWYNLSFAQGFDQSIGISDPELRERIREQQEEQFNNLKAKMTSEQIAEGQRLTREFNPRKAPEASSFVSENDIVGSNPEASGTGFFITDDGFLVTNAHVVKDAAQVRLVTSTGLIVAKVVQVDAANDLALLKTEARFAPLPIAASRSVQLGNTVATVGFPDPGLQGFSPKLAKGEIAALAGAGDDARYFQISVPVQPGNSGGALVDEHGNVVGIVSAKLNAAAALASSGALPENVNYAVKSSFLLSFLESVPVVAKKLKEPSTADRKFEDVVKQAQAATVLVLVY